MDVLCVGNATIDVFVLLHKLQKFSYDKFSNSISFTLGEKIPLDEYQLCLGGNACNVSVGLSRLGLKTSLAAEVGSDEFSEKIINDLNKEGVDQTFIDKETRKTPHFNIVLSYEGDRTILEEKNPSDGFSVGSLNPKLIYLTSLNGDWRKIYDKVFASNPNSLFSFNPGTRQISEKLNEVLNLLPGIEILFVNLSEAQNLTKDFSPDIKTVMGKLKNLGAKISIVTDGINGSYAIDRSGEVYKLGAVSQEKPRERTGAGDSYATGFMYGILTGRSISDAMRYGAINAESVIREIGAQKGLLTKEEIEQESREFEEFTAQKLWLI
ncbi:MAG: hypothetical protein US51_C0034G0005 [Microgenomates group bacterium GW2011_GWA2_37_6]|nr:MAG: hypothetical protein US51_C0034G0005 [Microgenomates group bacterium GW2011_GWA2_37_6]